MSNRRNRGDDTLGFGLNIFGSKEVDLYGFKKSVRKKSMPQPKKQESFPDLAKGGPGELMAGKKNAIELPLNFHPPEHAESVDVRKLINVPPASGEVLLLSFTAQTAQAVTFYKYGIFTDALDASLVEFIPRINGSRILRYHGDPQDNFKLNLSVGPNLNDSNMIACQLYLKPEDTITWHVINNDAVINPMGVRLTGYVDTSLKRKTMSFGG